MGKLSKKIEEHAAQQRAKFQRMLASHGIEVHPASVAETIDSAAPEAERQQIARERDRRTRLGRGNQ